MTCLGPASAQAISPNSGTNTINTIQTPLLLAFPSLLRTRLIAHNSMSKSTTASTIHVVSICMSYLLMVFGLGGPWHSGFIKFAG
ncbi:hypothetical protein Pfl01_2387 [Pseudomonas fluorescens Pf0-1]|uniref:Uncharacterized protein n=1 Tax=Pseudomonas fluorescens (strain Pf0-1) TaxID=205922 RepID=Q3KDM6_PSEPF|nr:hypothetical protein Pfl01_2387 [Pseudomonas fluorescens Pf0-1]